MIIYQVHEKHGKHLALTQPEAESNRKFGWKDVTKEEFYGQTKKVDSVPPLQTGTLVEASKEAPKENVEAPKRRGRPKRDISAEI